MIQFIDDHKDEFRVEPVCRHLPIAPQTYYAAKTREPSLRSITDEGPTTRIQEIHASNYGVYRVGKFTPNCVGRAARLPAARLSG